MNSAIRNTGMPYLIPAAGFDDKFSDTITRRNDEDTRYFMDAGVSDFTLPGLSVPPGYRLVRAVKGHQYRLIALSGRAETVYAVKLVLLKNVVAFRESCTQIMVWRTVLPQHDEAVAGLARRFFRYFLSRYAIVVSDSEHTGDGKRFWEVMIAWALAEPDYHVYLSDGSEEGRPLKSISSWGEFHAFWAGYAWGSNRDLHPHRLFVISSEQLPCASAADLLLPNGTLRAREVRRRTVRLTAAAEPEPNCWPPAPE